MSNVPNIITKCNTHKGYNIKMAKQIWSAYPGDKIASQIYCCGDAIDTKGDKIVAAGFCKDRFCPMCQWRRSVKLQAQNNQCMSYLLDNCPGMRFVFLTLTVPSIPLDDLRQSLNDLSAAWRKFYKSAWFKKLGVVGMLRTTEITYNRTMDTWHPHIHCLIAVKKGVWLPPHSEWLDAWRVCTCNPFIMMVNIKAVKSSKSVLEVSKYCLKPSSILDGFNFAEFYQLRDALHHLRFFSALGIFKDVRKALNLSDIESSDALFDGFDDDDTPVLHWRFNHFNMGYGICDLDISV